MKKIVLMMLMLLPLVVGAQSELYRSYASRADLTVAQVSGFRLNDTVAVDVVLVVADDDAAWQRLASELDIRATEGVASWLGDIRQPGRCTTCCGKPVLRVVASPARRTVGFYRIDNEAQYDAIIDYQLNQQKGKTK